jgi:hypothetical protein
MVVRKRLATYFQRGMPPASGSPRKRLPSTMSAAPVRIGAISSGMRLASYW